MKYEYKLVFIRWSSRYKPFNCFFLFGYILRICWREWCGIRHSLHSDDYPRYDLDAISHIYSILLNATARPIHFNVGHSIEFQKALYFKLWNLLNSPFYIYACQKFWNQYILVTYNIKHLIAQMCQIIMLTWCLFSRGKKKKIVIGNFRDESELKSL